MEQLNEVTFTLHNELHRVKTTDVAPETTLVQYLREYEHLKGTKYMCLEGGCGTCIVAVTVEHPISKRRITISVNSCLVSIYSCQGWIIHTIDGIGNKEIGYHPIQKRLAEFNGTQCGFCSPGMVMNMYPIYESNSRTMKEVEDSFGGNLCRCTGYRPILAAFRSFAVDANTDISDEYPDIEDFEQCINRNSCSKKCGSNCKRGPFSHKFSSSQSQWYKVFSINEIFDVLAENPNKSYRLVAGNTAKGVYHPKTNPDIYIDITSVARLLNDSINRSSLIVGANKTLNDTIKLFRITATEKPNFSYLDKLAHHITLVAHVSVRNIGTLAGNLTIKHDHKEFPSDIFLIFETVGAKLTIIDAYKIEKQHTLKDFLEYDMSRKVIKNIILPSLDDSYKYGSYKIMPRAQNAHAIVNAGFLLRLNKMQQVMSASIVYGGISPSFVHATRTENYLVGKYIFDNTTLQAAFNLLNEEIQPDNTLPQPSPEYRKQLAIALFYKYILNIAPESKLSPEIKSGGALLERPLSTGVQEFGSNKSQYPLTEPIPKLNALQQTSGETEYILDKSNCSGELYASFVIARAKANSIITKIDTSEALKLDGVLTFYDKNDIPGRNTFFPKETNYPPALVNKNFVEEELFCSGVVLYYNQPIGIIVAKTQDLADKAANLVIIKYSPGRKEPLLTIQQILNANAKSKIVHEGSSKAKKKGHDVKHTVKGSFETGRQYHFHMETHISIVIPKEDEINIYSSTQWKDHVQTGVSTVLGIKENKINVFVRRIGGAYGGKITRSTMVASAAALAAYKLQTPVRMRMSFTMNMDVMGKRYPSYGNYEVKLNDKGKIQQLDYVYYLDYGIIGNEPIAYGTMSIFYSSYSHDTWNISVNSTRTDTTPQTYTRGPGHTTTMAMIESIMEHIAMELNISPFEIRTENMAPIEDNSILQYMHDIKQWSDYDNRKKIIEEFNQKNRWKKRGLTIVPMTFPFEVEGSYTALVAIYAGDGTVAVTHGGIEMGQGINTKVAQVCAYTLNIPLNMVSIKTSNNITCPNDFASVRSTTSEAVCYATRKACQILLERMKPIKDKMNSPTWQELVKKSNQEYVELVANCMYPPIGVKNYDIYGVCATEVEVDILTGLHQVVRVDLIEDAGTSMSPFVDIGQVEGAFIMGLGFWTTEELVYNKEGKLLTNRTWNYKPPGALDIPIDFRVKLPKNNPNPDGVLSSKATGEPSLCLSCSIAFAIRHAVASARTSADSNASKWYLIKGPSTVENTFMNSLNDYKQYKL